MPTRTVVSRSKRIEPQDAQDFPFTAAMIPSLAKDWSGPGFVRDYHRQAWEDFQRLPTPTTKDEAWRRTDLKGLNKPNFRFPDFSDLPVLSPVPTYLKNLLVDQDLGGQLVIQPNGVNLYLSQVLIERGVIFSDLVTAERQYPDKLAQIMGQVVHSNEDRFAALAAAFTPNGVFIYIPAGVQVEAPLHSILWGPGDHLAYFSHLMVWLEEGASLTYIHEAASPHSPGGQTLHAGIVELHVGVGANLNFVELQSWGKHVWNISHERARICRDATLDWTFGALGSHLTKNFTELDLIGQGATGRMSGFYFTNGDQHMDHDTQQNHLAPNTTSDLLFKGALKDHSRSVWQGMIYVAPDAQKTDGYQANRNLVLSNNARADSIPGLEILADDVRCSHGATVGRIDPEPMFYLLSRGIPYQEAERLIVEGFFEPIMQRIPFEVVRERLQIAINDKIEND
jgi:Fe-S cluster assembly protein SufD